MNSEAPIIVYTTPTCPDCRALKAWLHEKRIPFTENNLPGISGALGLARAA